MYKSTKLPTDFDINKDFLTILTIESFSKKLYVF